MIHTILGCLHKTNVHQMDPNRDPARDKDLRKISKICCAFLLVIFRSNPPKHFLTLFADRYLLRAAQNALDIKTMVASLRMLMTVAAESMLSNTPADRRFMSLNVPVDHYAGTDSSTFLRTAPRDVSEFAHKIIKVLCSEGWVKEKCLRNIDCLVANLISLKAEQSHCILQLICYPDEARNLPEEAEPKDQESYIEGILRNLQIWTQRQSRLQLLFFISIEKTVVADVARLTTGIIQTTPAGKHRTFRIPGMTRDVPNIWLLANLIGNLPDHLHQKVHNSATMILETGAKFGEAFCGTKKVFFMFFVHGFV